MSLALVKHFMACLILGISAILAGCDLLNPNEDEPSRHFEATTVHKLYAEKIDYYIYTYDSLDASPHSHYYENYTPMHDSLQARVSPYIRTVSVGIEDAQTTSRYVSYALKLTVGTDQCRYNFNDFFYLDIYDCEPPYCRNASQVVFRTKNHSYMEVFAKGEFSISEPSYYRFLGNDNTDGCNLNIYRNYRLALKNERVDMDIEFQRMFFYCGG